MSRESEDSTYFLVFSDDWGEHPSSCQHIFNHIAKKHPVIWVNSIGMRMPRLSFSDLRKIILKLKKMFLGCPAQRKSGFNNLNLKVVQPFMLPFLQVPGVRAFNRRSVLNNIQEMERELGVSSPIMIATAPNAYDYIGLFGEKKVIYYCVDDFSEWPGLNKDALRVMEKELAIRSDVFIATSDKLKERLSSEQNGKVFLLTHGVDVEFFSLLPEQEHSLLSSIPSPRVGYFGLFDDRSDQSLLISMAKLMPDISFVITGKIETDISKLEALDNIYFTGSVPYEELPAIAKGYDICMLPYKLNELTEAIQPLKLKEYIATGKPVISTPMKESVKLKTYINISDTPECWVEAIRLYLKTGLSEEDKKVRESFLRDETWEGKSEQFLKICVN